MGQSQSTIHAGERLIKMKNVKQRLDKETLAKLKSEFDRISEAGVSRAALWPTESLFDSSNLNISAFIRNW